MKYIFNLFCFLLFLNLIAGAQSLEQRALEYIQQTAPYYGLTEPDLSGRKSIGHYHSAHNGLHHYFYRQQYKGIDIYNADINVNINQEGEVVFMRNQFYPQLLERQMVTTASLSPVQALFLGAEHLQLTFDLPPTVIQPESGPDRAMSFDGGGISMQHIPSKLIYYPVNRKQLTLCWELRIYPYDGKNWWTIWIDANSGEIIDTEDWVIHCKFDSEANLCHKPRHYDNKHFRPSGLNLKNNFAPNEYQVYAAPVESPNHGTRTIQFNPASSAPNASPFGWHDTNGSPGSEFTITRGNNVHAYQDRDNINSDSNDEPDGGPNLDFSNFPLDLTLAPVNYVEASTVNLFYWCNIMHDVWYQYGFDEASGNFQSNNYGNGGVGGDFIRAEAQDAANNGTRNNANFSGGPDGSTARIQMYLWSAPPSPDIFTVNSPGSVAGSYNAVEAAFGPGLNTSPVTGNFVEVDDGTGSPSLGCSALVNGGVLTGNIALIDRGTCEFGTKVLNAENAGAIAAIICNNAGGGPITMGPGADGNSVNIPSVMISQADCATIRAQLPGVNITLVNNGSAPERDGDLDNGIIAHEYGHGISIRLTGGPEAICLNNEEQMGEGWSDWFALIMTLESGDVDSDPRGMGTYAIGESTSGTGIRPAPYSTDPAVNDYDYSDLGNGEISVPHGVGFIWATMLWDLTWAFIDVYGFNPDLYSGNGGNNMAMQLIIDGMKIQGCSPGFVDGRDAILAADEANYAGVHECLIWEVFANRGLGFSADQGDSNNRSDGIAAFDLPPGLSGLSLTKSVDIFEVPEGGTLTYALQAKNLCETNTSVSISDQLPSNLTYVNGSATGGGAEAGGVVSYPVISSLSPNTTSSLLFFQGTVDPGSYYVPIVLLNDDMESGTANWSTAGSSGAGNWVLSTANANSGSFSWFAQDFSTQSDQRLTFSASVPLTGLATLSFRHFYDSEVTWDGGVVEISTDNGTTWEDLGPLMILNGYNSYINANPQSAISRRPAFSGNSNGYIETQVRLCEYSGQSVLIRFRFASDGFVGGDGWYIDDVMLVDEAALVNTGMVTATGRSADATVCSKIINLLAVDNILLEAIPQNDHITLDWTIEGSGSMEYALERSTDPLESFSVIHVPGIHESDFSGKFDDFDVEPFTTYYYRLTWKDEVGQKGYSEIVTGKIVLNDIFVKVKPNPVGKQFKLQIKASSDQKLDLTIYNIEGRTVMENTFMIPSGKTEKEIRSGNWSPGIYILALENEAFSRRVKLVKD